MKQDYSRNKKKSKSFNPSRDDISEAMHDFLNKGGKIKKIESLTDDEMDRILSQYTEIQ
ncbi:hypothetical protein KKI24_19450 [bacterium]|nr:hypothetical protein [bacterium]